MQWLHLEPTHQYSVKSEPISRMLPIDHEAFVESGPKNTGSLASSQKILIPKKKEL